MRQQICSYQFSLHIINQMRSKRAKAPQIPSFIEKLIEMLDDKEANNCIRWTEDLNSFLIVSTTQFTLHVLSKYFKHQNYSSFIRQLNMYGFKKIRHEEGENVYMNQFFKKGNRSILKNIKRKITVEKQDQVMIYNNNVPNVKKEINELKSKQKNLQQICKNLAIENKKLMMENNNLMKQMTEDSREKNKKLQQVLFTLLLAKEQINSLPISHNANLLSLSADMSPEDVSEKQIKQLQQDNNLLKFQQLMNNVYNVYHNKQPPMILNQQQNQEPKQPQELSIIIPRGEIQEKQNSILSINDFLNIEDSIDLKNK